MAATSSTSVDSDPVVASTSPISFGSRASNAVWASARSWVATVLEKRSRATYIEQVTDRGVVSSTLAGSGQAFAWAGSAGPIIAAICVRTWPRQPSASFE